jgi:membrane protein implicated in regulation of membrane protease activity
MSKKCYFVLIVISGFLISCGYLAVQFAPVKRPSKARSDASQQADALFGKRFMVENTVEFLTCLLL